MAAYIKLHVLFSYHVTTVWMMILTTAVTYTGGILLGKLNSEKPDKDADRETKKAFKKDITNKKRRSCYV